MSKFQINESLEDYIREETSNILDDLKVNKNFKGYRLLITTTILIIIANQCNISYTTEEMYLRAAAKHQISKAKVEKDIRYINEAYQIKIQEYFNLEKKISNKQFIFLLSDKVETRIRGKTKMFFKEDAKVSEMKSEESRGN